jgi:hypothetical protein
LHETTGDGAATCGSWQRRHLITTSSPVEVRTIWIAHAIPHERSMVARTARSGLDMTG